MEVPRVTVEVPRDTVEILDGERWTGVPPESGEGLPVVLSPVVFYPEFCRPRVTKVPVQGKGPGPGPYASGSICTLVFSVYVLTVDILRSMGWWKTGV